MGKRYEVTSSVLADTIEFEDGDMNKFSLSLKDLESGNVLNEVAQWRPAGSRQGGFSEGSTIEADVKTQPRGGLKLANAKLISGGGSSNGDAPQGGTTEVIDYRRTDTGRSIERQVALKAAVELLPEGTSANEVVENAKVLAAFLHNDPPTQEVLPDSDPSDMTAGDDGIPF